MAFLGLLERPALPGRKAYKALLVLLARQAQLVFKVQLGRKVFLVQPARKVRPVYKAQPDQSASHQRLLLALSLRALPRLLR